MKNLNKVLILLISVVFISSGVFAQSELSPKLKNQLEQKVKPPKAEQKLQSQGGAEQAPTPLQQMQQANPERDVTTAFLPSEMSASAKKTSIPTDELFDLQFDWPVAIGGGEAGIETDGDYIYTSMWNGAGEFQKYDTDGNWVETFSVAGSTGCRDIAYDGTYFYGGAASTVVFQMDFSSASMVSTFTAPVAVRAIAYDEDEDAFYANNWSDDITKFDMAGANLGSFPVGPTGISYYGFAYQGASYCGDGPFLWGYAQTGTTLNELVQISLPDGAETGTYFDVGSVAAVGTGIAGGLAIADGLVTGYWTIMGTAQNVDIWGLELCTSGPAPGDDIGVQSIVAPASGLNLTNAEAVTIMVKNYGTNPQSNFDVSFTFDGGTPVVESVSTTLNSGETYEHTFGTTVDLSAYGTYEIVACTDMTGDENPDNDCKTKMVENIEPSLCLDGLYSTGCDFGDGLIYWDLADVNDVAIDCAGTPYAWYHDFTDMSHTFLPGLDYTLTVQAGYSSTYLDVWVDWNNDLFLDEDEHLVDDFVCTTANTNYEITISIPATAPAGDYILRYRTNWLSGIAGSCDAVTYGNMCDFTAHVVAAEYGDLEGYVTENTGGAPIEGASIVVNNGSYTTTSGSDGYYLIEEVLAGDWAISCTKDGYNPMSGTVTINVGATTQYDFAMTAPTMDITPTSISITIDPNAQATEYIDIANNGDGMLHWSSQLEMLTDGTEDMFDLIWDVPVGIGGGEAGIETDGTYIYTSMWNGAGEFQKYDAAGNWMETFTVAGSTGCRDIAYDGTYFYGGAATTTVFQMDFGTATMVSTFTAPTAVRAIAYNENDDLFYANNWGSDITMFDMTGANLGSFACGPFATSYYGFAYDNYSTPGTPYLWGYAQDGTTLNELVQIDLTTQVETGFTFDVGTVAAVGTGIAGGLAIDNMIVPGLWVFLGTSQNVDLWALELGPAGPVWISTDPTSGDVDPGNADQMTVSFDATDIIPGTVKTANIHFMSDPDVGTVTVPVTMVVGNLDWGYVEGTITLDGSAPYNIGDVTEVLVEVGPYSGYPDASGNYSIQVYPGTYDEVATLYGYQTTTVSGVTVTEGNTETVDITMPIMYGIVDGTVTAANGGAAIEGATVVLVGTEFSTTTAADGSYSFTVEAGNYDVKVTAPFFASQTANVDVMAETTTTQDFSLEDLEGIIVVIDLDPTPNAELVDVIQGFFPGGLVEYTTSINGYPLDEQVQTVFLMLGIFANNYTLTESDAVVITTWLDTYGGNLYMEGGDTWAYDAATSLHGYFNINGVADGGGDLATVTGIDSYWAAFEWSYVGENNWIDHLEAIAPAINVMENSAVGYYTGVAYDAGDYKTVGASHEITGLDDGATGYSMGVASVMAFFGYPVFAYGNLEGYVTEVGSGDPIEGATIQVGAFGTGTSGSDGYYLIEDILVGDWTAVCSADGYNSVSADVTIEEGVTATQDFELTAPAFNVDPTSISVTLEPNQMATETIDINNPGNGDLNWSASLSIIGGSNNEAMFDLIWDVPVGIGGGEAGIETDGQYIYTSMWNGAGEFQRYSMNGTWVETISVAGSTGCRDIAYNGTYFYGGAASTTVFEMDLANATMISTFTAPTEVRAIAVDSDGNFYANNWGSDIVKFDMAGANLGSFACGPFATSYYGFAWDGYSDGGPYLWGYAQDGTTLNELVQMQLPAGGETGLTFDVGTVAAVGTGIAGGLSIDDHIQAGMWAFLGTSQNVDLWALELTEAQSWISITPTSGSLTGGSSETMDVNFDATDLLPGVYMATISFSTNPNVGSPVVDVTMTVEGLIPAVNLSGMAECTDVMLSWDMPTGGDPDSWKVYRDGEFIGDASTMEYTDEMVDPEVEYTYAVTAVYAGEESQPSSPFMITVATPGDLEALNPVATQTGLNQVTLVWEAPEGCLTPDEYDVYRDGAYVATTTELSYVDDGLGAGFYEYYIVSQYYFGEGTESDAAYVLVITGVNELNSDEFQMYPNPATDVVNVKSDYNVASYEVLNNAGQVVFSTNVDSRNFQINVSEFERGIYYIKLQTSQGIALRKIAVK
ncbi:MAG: carboxypeptidase regulatory-like domain-containing protein [Bacteroidales bacterium]